METIILWFLITNSILLLVEKNLYFYFLCLWIFKTILVIFLLPIYYNYYGWLDIFKYLEDGKFFATTYSFFTISKMLFSSMILLNNGTTTLTLLVGLIYSLFPSQLCVELFFSASSIIGYYYLIKLSPVRSTDSIYLILYFPFSFFFLSTICKDTIIFTAMSGYIYHSYKLLTEKFAIKSNGIIQCPGIKHIIMILFWIVIGFNMRFWVVYILLATTVVWILVRLCQATTLTIRMYALFFTIFLLGIFLFFKIDYFRLIIRENILAAYSLAEGGSAIAPLNYHGTLRYLLTFPFYSLYIAFEPFVEKLPSSTGLLYDFSIISNLILFIMLILKLLSVLKYKISGQSTIISTQIKIYNIILYCIILIVIFMFAYTPILYSNLGTGLRFKSTIMVFFLYTLIHQLECHYQDRIFEPRNKNV